MMRTTSILVALVVTLNVSAAQVFTVDRDSINLRTIDPNTGATLSTTPIGGAIGIGFNGLTCDPISGDLYAIENLGGFVRCLVAIDPLTGVETFIGPLPNGMATLTFDSFGLLMGVTGDGTNGGRLYCIDPNTGVSTVLTTLLSLNGGEEIAVDPFDPAGTIYRFDGVDLLSVDPATFAETYIATPPVASDVTGMGFCALGEMLVCDINDDLYAVTITGVTTFLGNLVHQASGIVEAGLFAPPIPPAYPGTNEDLITTWSRNNGVPVPVVGGLDLFCLLPGESFALHHQSPGGTFVFDGEVAAIGSILTTGSVFPTVFPGLHLNIPTAFPTVTSSVAGQPFYLPPQGVAYGGIYLGGPLAGNSVLIQCFLITNTAVNNIFASTNGVEIDLL